MDGWLYTMGAQDFAGGIVIHITSAVSGLVVCRALGPRRGFDPLGEAFPHSKLVLSAIGLGMLWVGWFGFNAGSSFAAGAQASEAIMNTHASACCSALAWLYMSQRNNERGNKPSFIAVMNGSIAGLAAITPAAGAFIASFFVFFCFCFALCYNSSIFVRICSAIVFAIVTSVHCRLRRHRQLHDHRCSRGPFVALELPRHSRAPAHRRRA